MKQEKPKLPRFVWKEDIPDIDMGFYLETVETRFIPPHVPQLIFYPRALKDYLSWENQDPEMDQYHNIGA